MKVKPGSRIHVMRVYLRYFWWKYVRRKRVMLFGRPGLPRFKCVIFTSGSPNLPDTMYGVPVKYVPRLDADASEPKYSIDWFGSKP